jgi:hypothetical protein
MFKEEKKLLTQETTQTDLLELIDSQDLFDSYNQKRSSSSLSNAGIPFLRKPNDEKNNRWVYPFPRDIWDYWINQVFDIKGNPIKKIASNDLKNYIDLPNTEESGREGGYYRHPFFFDQKSGLFSHIYEEKYKRLWDFIYNPNFFLNPELENTGSQKRLFPFPRYGSDGKPLNYDRIPSLVPPFLPDVVYENHPEMPYSNWQYGIPLNIPEFEDMLDPSIVLAQKVAFIRAYGSKPDQSLEMYEFDPVNITENQSRASSSTYFTPEYTETYSNVPFANELLILEKQPQSIIATQKRIVFYQPQRADFSKSVIYPRTSTYSPMPYAPIVIHNANNYESSGWYYFFRQKVRRSPSFPFPKDEKTYNQIMTGFKIYKTLVNDPKNRGSSLEYLAKQSALRVLPKEAAVYYGVGKFDPNTAYIRTISLSEEQKNAESVIDNLKELIIQAINTSLYEPVFDKNGDPVYESTPYKIVTVYVLSLKRSLRYNFKSFDFKKTHRITVPSFLNVSLPGYIDVEKNNRVIEWKPQGLNASLVNIDLSRGSNHHINIQFKLPGYYFIVCETQQRSSISGLSYVPNTVYRLIHFEVYELFLERVYRNPLNPVIEPITIEAKNIPFEEETSTLPLEVKLAKSEWMDTYFASPLLTKFVSEEVLPMESITESLELIDNEMRQSASLPPGFSRNSMVFFKKETASSSDSPLSRIIYIDDPRRPFLMTRHSKNPFRFYLFAVIYEMGVIYIDYFGTTVNIPSFIPVKECPNARLRVSLSNTQGEYLVEKYQEEYRIKENDNGFSFLVNHPNQLTMYYINIHVFNDTCTNEKDGSLVYNMKYQIKFSDSNIDQRQLLFGQFDLDKNGVPYHDTEQKKRYGYRLFREPEDQTYVFFRSMCRVYTRLYHIDLFNFATLYPFVVKYCQEMENFIKHHDPEGRIAVIDDVPSDLKGLVPSSLHPPYLFISVSYITNIEGKDTLYYVIFDPIQKGWINILSFENSATIVTDPRLCIPIEGSLATLVSEISKYYPFVPIKRDLFVHESRISQKKLAISSPTFSTNIDLWNVKSISDFITQNRKLFLNVEKGIAVLSRQKIKHKLEFQQEKLDELGIEIAKAADEMLYPVFYQILRENELRFYSFCERLFYFFRIIRESLKEPLFLENGAMNNAYDFKNPINKLLILEFKKITEMRQFQGFLHFRIHLYRIGYCDIGFMFLKNAYPIDFIRFDAYANQKIVNKKEIREELTSELDTELRKKITGFVNSDALYSDSPNAFDFLYNYFIDVDFFSKFKTKFTTIDPNITVRMEPKNTFLFLQEKK